MIVQACLNGARPHDYHPELPITAAEMAHQGAACIASGAAELHVHPRGADGQESLSAVDETMLAMRRACPGTLIGVSTGAWIEGDEKRTRERIAAWRERPDYASVNLSEPDAPAVMATLRQAGAGAEAGLASIEDARRFVSLDDCRRVFRILIEIEDQDVRRATELAAAIADIVEAAAVRRPILLHGFDATVWPMAELASQHRWSTRVGLEDGKHLPNGTVAQDNAALVVEAVKRLRAS